MKLFFFLSALASASAVLTTSQMVDELWARWNRGDIAGWADLYADGAEITWNNPTETFELDGTHFNGQDGFTVLGWATAIAEQYEITEADHTIDYTDGKNELAYKMHMVMRNKKTGSHNRYDIFAPVRVENGKCTSTAWHVYKVTPHVFTMRQMVDELWARWNRGDIAGWADLYADGAELTWNNPTEKFQWDGTHVNGQGGFTVLGWATAMAEQYDITAADHTVDYTDDKNQLLYKMHMVMRNKETGTNNRYDIFAPVRVENGKCTYTAWHVYKVTPGIWKKQERKHCGNSIDGNHGKKYDTFEAAKTACLKLDKGCQGVYDQHCDGKGPFLTCKPVVFGFSSKSCVLTQPVANKEL